jgi:hypothetical protein
MKPSSLPILAAFIAGIGVAGYAIAECADRSSVPNRLVSETEHANEPVPAPVTGVLLFTEIERGAGFDSDRETCVTAAQVLGIFAREIETIGGEIQTLSGRLQQDFADQWRQTAGLTPVDVSRVFAHVVPSQYGDAIVDVVEFDTEGCALSRTLITDIEWVDLIQASRGLEV